MKFLENLEFDENQITELKDGTPDKIIELLQEKEKLVAANLSYLKDLGINKYREIFLKYPDMFLMDNSNFEEIFSKYEVEDLKEKIDKNISIVEFL